MLLNKIEHVKFSEFFGVIHLTVQQTVLILNYFKNAAAEFQTIAPKDLKFNSIYGSMYTFNYHHNRLEFLDGVVVDKNYRTSRRFGTCGLHMETSDI
jgi:hypothetical protein